MNRHWYCLIGPVDDKVIEDRYSNGADLPPRMAVRQAIFQTFGVDPVCASGWLTQQEADNIEHVRFGSTDTPAAALQQLTAMLDGVKLDTLPDAFTKLLPAEKYINPQTLLSKLYDKTREEIS